MTLLYPYMLLLLVFPIILFIIINRFKKNKIFTKKVRKRLLSKEYYSNIRLRQILYFLLFFFIVISLARPVLIEDIEGDERKNERGYLAISLDVSKSMLAQDIVPNRLEFSKIVISKIMKNLPETKIALSAFSRDVFMISPFSDDKDSIDFLLKNLDQDSLSSQGSSIQAVIQGTKKVYSSSKQKIKDLLIVTDGADGLEVEESLKLAIDNNIRVHLIIIGTKKGAMIPYNNDFIQDSNGKKVITKRSDALKELSIQTKGVFLINSGSLDDIQWLSKQIEKKTEKSFNLTKEKIDTKELFRYPLTLALIMLFLILFPIRLLKLFSFLVLMLFSNPKNLEASIFDFFSIIKSHEYYSSRNHSEALPYFKKLHKEKATVYTQYNLANSYYRNRNFDEAIKLYESIDTKDKTLEYERLHNLGNAYVAAGNIDEAIKVYKMALEIKNAKSTAFNLQHILKPNNVSAKGKSKKKKKKKKKTKPKGTKKSDSNKKPKKKNDDKKEMSEKEAKKWERKINNIGKPKTKPQKYLENKQLEKNRENYW